MKDTPEGVAEYLAKNGWTIPYAVIIEWFTSATKGKSILPNPPSLGAVFLHALWVKEYLAKNAEDL
jgi:hypothetical protein